jgi:hypothetical protein
MVQWAVAGVASVLVPALSLASPAVGDGAAAAAAAIVAALVLASVVVFHGCAAVLSTWKASAPSGATAEDRHRRGAFRRQHAPGIPGRPGRPRAPGLALVGLTHRNPAVAP